MQYRLNRNEILFFISYSLYVLVFLLNCTAIKEMDTVQLLCRGIRYVCYLLAVVKVVRTSFTGRQILQSIVMLFLIAMVVLASGEQALIFHALIFWAAKDVNSRTIIKITLILQTIIVAVFVVLSQIGIIVDMIANAETRARHMLGFEWANTVPTLFFFMVLSYIYLRKEKLRLIEIIIIELINLWLYIMTDTRMSFLLLSLVLVYVFFMKLHWQNHTRFRNKWLVLMPSVVCVFSLALHWMYNEGNAVWDRLNMLLSRRLAYGYSGIHTYGIHLFGTPIEWVGFGLGAPADATYNYVDCSYLKILLSNGIVFLVLIILAYTYVMYKAVKINDLYLQTALLAILIFSITEPRLFHFAYNPFPILALSLWGTDKIRAEKSIEKQGKKMWKWQTYRIRLKTRR